MIQRIQSLYIFIFIINKCYLLYKSSIDTNSFHLYIEGYDLFSLLLILLIIFSTVTLFRFKNRKIQIKLMYFLIIIQVIVLTLIFFLAYKINISTSLSQNYDTFHYLFGLLLLLLSLRGIKKDQNLIDSMDRLR